MDEENKMDYFSKLLNKHVPLRGFLLFNSVGSLLASIHEMVKSPEPESSHLATNYIASNHNVRYISLTVISIFCVHT